MHCSSEEAVPNQDRCSKSEKDIPNQNGCFIGAKTDRSIFFQLFYQTAFCYMYSVSNNFIYPSKELCSKMALGEVGLSLP